MKTEQNSDKAQLTQGNIYRTLSRLTIPMIFGILSIMFFNLVDTYFIGKLGVDELAAISFTFPVVFLLGSIAMGLGIGTSSVISRAIGEGDHHKVRALTTDSLILSFLIVVVFAIVGVLTIEPVFQLLGATGDIIPLIKDYMVIWYIGIAFLVIPMVGNNAIRATGDTLSPSIIMVIAGTVNVILDPLLIFGIGIFPRMEMQGAALATVIARAVALAASLRILYYREKMISFSRINLKKSLESWKSILYIALPASGTKMLLPLSTGVITKMISGYGPQAVAAFGVGSRIEPVALFLIMALASALAPFIGQNWGAGNMERIRHALKICIRFALIWEASLAIILFFTARPLAMLFTDDAVVVSIVVDFLWIIPLSYGLQSVYMLTSISFNVINRPFQSALLSIIRLFGMYLPFAYIGSQMMGITGIFIGCTIANILIGIISLFWVRKI